MALFKVRYKGLSTKRVLPAKDLKKHGVAVDKDLVFEPANRHTLVLDGLSEPLENILRDDKTFTVSEVKDGGAGEYEVIKGSALDDTANTVKDSTTGQTSTKK